MEWMPMPLRRYAEYSGRFELPGTNGPNRFGDDPKGIANAEVIA